MADFVPHLLYVDTQVFVKGTGKVTRSLPDGCAIFRRPRPVPFNVQGIEDPRPVEGQIWPRGLPQQGL